MPSPFDALWSGVQPLFDAAMAELITIEPKAVAAGTAGRRIFAAKGDPANLPFTVRGIFRGQTVVDRAPLPAANKSDAPDIVVNKVTADFDASQFTDATMPREGWTLVLTSRPGAPRYTIGVVKPDFVSRVWCPLTSGGTAP